MAIDFNLTEEQELILESYIEFIENCGFDDEYFDKCWDECRYPVEYYKAFYNSPLGMLGLPEDVGGTPADAQTMAMLEVKAGELGRPTFTTAVQNLHPICLFGTADQKQRALDAMLKGYQPAALCISEPGAGSDNSGISTRYERKDGKIIINGMKTMITNATVVPQFQVLCRDFNVENYAQGMTAFMIPADTPGITMEAQHKIGVRQLPLCEVYFKDVEIDESCLFGVEHQGYQQMFVNLEFERLMIAAFAVGSAKRAFNLAADYANQRVQFGKPIGDKQLIQEMITRMGINIELGQNFVYKVAWMIDNGLSTRIEGPMLKYFAARAQNEVCDDALQIFGGIGYLDDAPVSRLWRDARTSRIGGGTDEVMVHVVGRGLLKKAAKK